jgi:hypothetical protein
MTSPRSAADAGSSNRGSAGQHRQRARSTSSSHRTANHDEIRRWVESRGGRPARIVDTQDRRGSAGLLRIDFTLRGRPDRLEEISWEEFFSTMDRRGLDLVYQDKTADGRPSRFSKLVRRI